MDQSGPDRAAASPAPERAEPDAAGPAAATDAAASGAAFRTQRVLPHPPAAVFAAFADAGQLARWWGPRDFTNTFERFEFRPGGVWRFVMHGPNGAQFQNESTFVELRSGERIVIQHLSKPRYLLTVTLSPEVGATLIVWEQVFEEPAVAARVRHIVEPANEQNLDRLGALLGQETSRS